MRVLIVFDSATGTTRAAAHAMAEIVRRAGHDCTVTSVQDVDPASVRTADALCIGSWCKGLFFVRQHATPAILDFIDGLDDLDGTPVAVFCTYKTAVGRMLDDVAARVERRGGTVTGSFRSRGPFAADGVEGWVQGLRPADRAVAPAEEGSRRP